MSRKDFIKTLKTRSEVAAAAPELIKTEKRKNEASSIYLEPKSPKGKYYRIFYAKKQ
jgi:hypothetical protein